MSYTTLSQAMQISRTGISHHFPKKTDWSPLKDDFLLKLLIDRLVINEVKWSIERSWQRALQQWVYRDSQIGISPLVIRSELLFSQRLMDNLVKVVINGGTQANKQVKFIGR